MTTNFNELPAFSKEFKRLAKKHRSLPDDLEEFKRVVEAVLKAVVQVEQVAGRRRRDATRRAQR